MRQLTQAQKCSACGRLLVCFHATRAKTGAPLPPLRRVPLSVAQSTLCPPASVFVRYDSKYTLHRQGVGTMVFAVVLCPRWNNLSILLLINVSIQSMCLYKEVRYKDFGQ